MVYDDPRLHGSWRINVPGVKADDALKLFKKIEAENGNVTPKQVVDVSREEGSLLHNQFEWNDEIAAVKYREKQAQWLIGNLVVTVKIDKTQESAPVRAMVHVKDGYNSVDNIIKVPETRELLFKKAIEELEAFKRKYADLLEFTKLFDEIDKLKEVLVC